MPMHPGPSARGSVSRGAPPSRRASPTSPRRGRHPPAAGGHGLAIHRARRADDPRSRRHVPHPRPGHPARVARRVDLPQRPRPHPGHRPRREGPQAVPVPRALPPGARRGQVRPHARLRAAPCPASAGGWRGTSAPPGLPSEKVLAALIRLLETTLIRVGNEEYAQDEPLVRPDHAAQRPRLRLRPRGPLRLPGQERQGPRGRRSATGGWPPS